jgi:hypothetical protein
MDMDQAAVFLAGSILTALGFIVFVIAVVVINNIIHRWWKPLGWSFGWISAPTRFATPEEIAHITPQTEINNDQSKAKDATQRS